MQIAHITAELDDDGLTVHVTGRVNLGAVPGEDGERISYTTDLTTAQSMFGIAVAMGAVVG